MRPEEKEKRIEKIRMSAVALTDEIKELDEGGISMWQEIINYIYEKKDQNNG